MAKSLDVPGDLSSAVFFIAAAYLFPESSLLIHNVGLNPTRTAILDLFLSMGAAIQTPTLRSGHGELVGDLAVKGATLIGNGPDVLTRVSMVANDLALDSGVGTCGKDGQSVPVGVGLPTIKIDGITVGGTRA